jgi:hypothetical protein
MQNESPRKSPALLVYLFLAFTVLFGAAWAIFSAAVVDFRVLMIGNTLLFAIGYYSVRMSTKGLLHKNPQFFLRMVYGSLMLKLFLISIAAFVYIARFKQAVNKPALFGFFILYLFYAVTEVRLVLQQSKQKNA